MQKKQNLFNFNPARKKHALSFVTVDGSELRRSPVDR